MPNFNLESINLAVFCIILFFHFLWKRRKKKHFKLGNSHIKRLLNKFHFTIHGCLSNLLCILILNNIYDYQQHKHLNLYDCLQFRIRHQVYPLHWVTQSDVCRNLKFTLTVPKVGASFRIKITTKDLQNTIIGNA